MLIILIIIVVSLVSWSLHLMQEAVDQREFSLMLAGTLVAFSAVAMIGVYFLMSNYVGYVAQISHDTAYTSQPDIPLTWSAEDIQQVQAFYQ